MPARSAREGGSTQDREIVITRLIEAPRALVFKAWTTPHHLGNWFGPRGFTATTTEFSLKPGGVWRFVLHGPDGVDYRNLIRFTEVVPNQRLVYNQNGDADTDSPLFHVTVTFEEEAGHTRLTLRMVFDSPAARQGMVEYGAVEGGEQTLARLAEYAMPLGAGEFILERSFAAPREVVWRTWSQAEHLARWWGPRGCKVTVRSIDLRPGGEFHYWMDFGETTVRARIVFRQIEPPSRLVYLDGFTDEKGALARHPWDAKWPMEMLTTVEFIELEKGTLVRIRWSPWNANEAERAKFVAGFDSCFGGWSGMLDKLDDHLAAH